MQYLSKKKTLELLFTSPKSQQIEVKTLLKCFRLKSYLAVRNCVSISAGTLCVAYTWTAHLYPFEDPSGWLHDEAHRTWTWTGGHLCPGRG